MTKDENETNPGKIPAGLQLTNKRTIHLQNSKFLMFSNIGGGGGGRQGKKKKYLEESDRSADVQTELPQNNTFDKII